MGFAQSAIEPHQTWCRLRGGFNYFRRSVVAHDPDPEHSLAEKRYVTMGRAFNAKLLVVVHTDRGDNIRIISARHTSRRERKFYEEIIE